MQLKKQSTSVSTLLATATCTLLGGAAQQVTAEEWEVDSAVLFYSEPDRVTAVEPVINMRKQYADDAAMEFTLTLDSLTGASANGATATNTPQTFTSPSGKGTYTADANETPLDDTFLDTRVALAGNWEKDIDRVTRYSLGASASKEYDYLSLSVNGLFNRDFNQKNTTLQAGLSFAADEVDPVGGAPIAFASMADVGDPQPKESGTQSKDTIDFLLGVTQTLGHNTIGQLNYSLSSSSGYQTDPYKLLSVVDGTTGDTLDYVYENRPEDRLKHSIYASIKHQFENTDIGEASYRLYTDDWGIDSHTIDLKYRFQFASARYLQPHIRYYSQTEADFYRHSLVDGEQTTLDEASADYRLGEFDAITAGLKYGMPVGNTGEFSIRGEYYLQSGNSSPGDAIGIQQDQDLYPDVDAYILQINYSFRW